MENFKFSDNDQFIVKIKHYGKFDLQQFNCFIDLYPVITY